MKISELGELSAGRIVIRGREVVVRPASSAVIDAVYALFPRPQPRLVQDPDRGSLAPKIPDVKDPVFIAEITAWNRRTDRIEAAIAIGLEVETNGIGVLDWRGRLKEWAEAAEREMGEALTREEIDRILAEAKRVASGAEENARKN